MLLLPLTERLGVIMTDPVARAAVEVAEANQLTVLLPAVADKVAVLPVHLLRFCNGVTSVGAAMEATCGVKAIMAGGKFEAACVASS
jgi:hypothetical protein